jgi:creatinine amidohydrolase
MIHEWDLAQTNLNRARGRSYEVAVLPLGAIEPHNLHLPYGTDFFMAAIVAERACARAWEKCQSVLCLPALPYGVDCNMMSFPLTATVTQATLDAMIRELLCSMRHHGIRKFVLVNGHGGNDFVPLVRQVQVDLDIHVFLADWWKMGMDRYDSIFTRRDDHSGQMETSCALAAFGELVELAQVADATPRPFQFEALKKGWVSTSRDFGKMTPNCASSDPSGSTAQRGEEYIALAAERLGDFLAELAAAPIDEHFPFKGP